MAEGWRGISAFLPGRLVVRATTLRGVEWPLHAGSRRSLNLV
jgi:hypothetical protein